MSGRGVLVVDVGTSSVRAAVVRPDASLVAETTRDARPDSPADGLVEFDAAALGAAALDAAREVLERVGPVDAVGVANQRASTVLWDPATGTPVGPGLGWQDLRTVGRCLELAAEGHRLAPNQSATKLEWLLDAHDPDRTRDLRAGTVDSWIAWLLTDGEVHVSDGSNVAVTGLCTPDARGWDPEVTAALRIPERMLPRIVDSAGALGTARALAGAPPLRSLVGDQQASLVGQGCVRAGDAKVTFGTGGMLDVCVGPHPPFVRRGPGGTFPILCWRRAGGDTWGIEAVMLTAGSSVEWLRDGLGLVADAAESHAVAARCADTGGVWFVPALLGLGTPAWDYGARGTFVGVTRGTGRPELVRAVLEGVAHRGADLVEAAEADAELAIPALRIDGGMSDNPTFVQALADATARPVEVSPVREATALGAGLLAGTTVGYWSGDDDLAATWRPRVRVEPAAPTDRDRWREATRRARGWIEELSGIDF